MVISIPFMINHLIFSQSIGSYVKEYTASFESSRFNSNKCLTNISDIHEFLNM